jgi:hypothetical protein
MKTQSLGLLVGLASTLACAGIQGSGVATSEARKVSDFQEIEAADGIRLEVKRGATSVAIEGDDNIVPLYATEVIDGRLVIRRKKRESMSTQLPLVVRVTTPTLRRLAASGGVEVSIEDITSPRFETSLAGGVEFEAKGLIVEELVVSASGGVEASFNGVAKNARLTLSGGVELKAKEMQVAQLDIEASGGCDVEVSSKESVIGQVSGGVGLKVHGHPAKSQVRTSGGADVDYVN